MNVRLDIGLLPDGRAIGVIVDASNGRHVASLSAQSEHALESMIEQAWVLVAASRRRSGQVWAGLTEVEATNLRLLLAGSVVPL
jgi:hypothetical protein